MCSKIAQKQGGEKEDCTVTFASSRQVGFVTLAKFIAALR
jgi:hypothetical protein